MLSAEDHPKSRHISTSALIHKSTSSETVDPAGSGESAGAGAATGAARAASGIKATTATRMFRRCMVWDGFSRMLFSKEKWSSALSARGGD